MKHYLSEPIHVSKIDCKGIGQPTVQYMKVGQNTVKKTLLNIVKEFKNQEHGS